MATTRRVAKARSEVAPPDHTVSQLELIDLFRRRAVYELVAVEVAPRLYRLEAIIAWRVGRWTLMGAGGPHNFRSLDTLARHLKTMGGARIVTRLELLT